MRTIGLMLLACSLCACQSTQNAMKIICNAPNECASCASKDEDTRAKKIALHIDQQVSNAEIKKMWNVLAAAPIKEQSTILQREAQRAGLSRCPLATEWASKR